MKRFINLVAIVAKKLQGLQPRKSTVVLSFVGLVAKLQFYIEYKIYYIIYIYNMIVLFWKILINPCNFATLQLRPLAKGLTCNHKCNQRNQKHKI